MLDKKYGCFTIVLALFLAVAFFFLEAWLVMLLWNATVVTIFALPALSFWVSCGILLLCNILFKSGTAAVSSLKQ